MNLGRCIVTFIAVALLTAVSACRTNAVIAASVDPNRRPDRAETILLAPPDNPSISERQLLEVLRTRLQKGGFTTRSTPEEAEWILTYAINRETNVVGYSSNTTSAMLGNTGVALGGGTTTVKRQTDVTISLGLFAAADRDKPSPPMYWEGSITTSESFYRRLPNALVDALLERFGSNAFLRVRVPREVP